MATRTFPGASKTFTVYRRLQTTTVGNNIVPVAPGSQTPIATGLSIVLKDLQDQIITDKGGAVFTGMYQAATFTDTPIIIGDIISDETENDRTGSPVRYSIEGVTHYPIYVKLHCKRLDIGI